MSRRKTSENDSLDMLLDTLCNTFGIIILIALLVAILTFQSRPADAVDEIATISRELLERRIANAEEDFLQAQARQEELQRQLATDELADRRRLVNEKDELELEISRVRNAADAVQESVTDFGVTETQDPGELYDGLYRQSQQLELRQTEIDNSLDASRQHLDHLERRKNELAGQLGEAEARRQRYFRLPRERPDARLEHAYVFVRYGEIFPMVTFSGGRESRNTHNIRWNRVDSRRTTPELMKGRGLHPEGDAWDRYLSTIPSNRYLSFVVWIDSFEAFGEAKSRAVGLAKSFSWEPVQPGVTIYFGSDGSPPPPPL